jgi:hypothetical protein
MTMSAISWPLSLPAQLIASRKWNKRIPFSGPSWQLLIVFRLKTHLSSTQQRPAYGNS